MAEFKPVKVIRGDVIFTCAESKEQLQLFLDAGYTVVEDKPKEVKKKTTKK